LRKSFFIAVECRVPNVDFIPDRFPIHGEKMRRPSRRGFRLSSLADVPPKTRQPEARPSGEN
jgi:hypothetical protein